MCHKSQYPGKFTKIRALFRRLSPNARISGRARIYPGDLGTLSLTKYCNLNVVCPPESPYLCQTPGSLSRSAPSSNSRLSPLCHLCRTPSLPAPCRLTCLVTISLCSSPLPRPPHSPHLLPPWRPKRVNF